MSANVQKAQILTQFQVTELPGTAPTGTSIMSFFNDLDQALFLSSTSTPAVSLFSVYAGAIGGGYTVDLTAAQGSNGTINATGKKLLALCVNATNCAGDVTIATGGSSGYTLPSQVVKAGGFALVYMKAALGAVGSTAKNISVSGTSDDSPEIGLLLG